MFSVFLFNYIKFLRNLSQNIQQFWPRAEQRRRLFIYFGHSGLLLVLRLFTVYRNAKPQTQLNRTSPPLASPWSGHKALRGPPWVTKPTFHPFNQPTKHAKQSRPARKGRAKKAGSNCLHAEKLNQKYFSQLKCLSQKCRKSSQRGRGLTEGGRQRKGHLGITKYVCKRDCSFRQHLNCKKSLLKKSVGEKYRMREKIRGKESVVGEIKVVQEDKKELQVLWQRKVEWKAKIRRKVHENGSQPQS